MNLIFNAFNRNAHEELKNILKANKIKYKIVDNDMCKIAFKVNKDNVNDFQMNLATNVFGARVPGTFYVED